MRKTCVTMLVVLLMIQILCPSYSMAEPVSGPYQVSVYDAGDEGLALKEYPNMDSYRLRLIEDESVLEIDQTTADGWGHTNYYGLPGWVYLRYTKVLGKYHAEFPSSGFVIPAYYGVYGTNGEGLEFRTRPTADSSTFGTLCDESVLFVQAIQGDWAFGYCNGRFGWANMAFLQLNVGGRGDPVESPTYGFIDPTYYTVCNTAEQEMELRCRPGADNNSFGSIYDGAVVEVLAFQNDWAFVYFNFQYAWCNAEYLQETDEQNLFKSAETILQYNLSLLTEQIKEVLLRYNFMDSHNGCASLNLARVSSEVAANLTFSNDPWISAENAPVYRYLDCHTIEEVLQQRREYFSDDILLSPEDFSRTLAEYDGNVYCLLYVNDSNSFLIDDLNILHADEERVVVTCAREFGGSLFRFRLTFQYHNYHLKMIAMEQIF